MGSRMKKTLIFLGLTETSDFQGGGRGHKKTIQRGDCLKRECSNSLQFEEGKFARQMDWCFQGGRVDTLVHTMVQYILSLSKFCVNPLIICLENYEGDIWVLSFPTYSTLQKGGCGKKHFITFYFYKTIFIYKLTCLKATELL